jgi:protein NrfD
MESLTSWDIRVTIDLFLGGIGIGAFLLSVLATLYDRERYYFSTARLAAVIAPISVGLGLLALIFKLGVPMRAVMTLWYVNPQSVMTIGVFLQTGFMIFSLIYLLLLFSKKLKFDRTFRGVQFIGCFFAVGVGLYHGLFLSSLGRVLWTEMIPGIFLISSLATGVATVMLIQAMIGHTGTFTSDSPSRISYPAILLGLLAVQFLSVLLWQFFTGRLELEQNISYAYFMERFGLVWNGFVLVLGIVLPAILAAFSLLASKGILNRGMAFVLALLILVGAFTLKHLIIMGGQVVVALQALS